MKRKIGIWTICFVALIAWTMPANAQTAAMKTVKLPNGEEVRDLTGEWNSVYDTGGWGTLKDIVKITQNGNQFVGIYLLNGDNAAGKNKEKIKGKIKGNVIDEVFFYDLNEDLIKQNYYWAPSEAKVSEDGNEIVIKRVWLEKGASIIRIFSLKRK